MLITNLQRKRGIDELDQKLAPQSDQQRDESAKFGPNFLEMIKKECRVDPQTPNQCLRIRINPLWGSSSGWIKSYSRFATFCVISAEKQVPLRGSTSIHSPCTGSTPASSEMSIRTNWHHRTGSLLDSFKSYSRSAFLAHISRETGSPSQLHEYSLAMHGLDPTKFRNVNANKLASLHRVVAIFVQKLFQICESGLSGRCVFECPTTYERTLQSIFGPQPP